MSDQSAPSPQAEPWKPPTSDQEFVFTTIQEAPEWVDKGWAGFSHGPALQVPAGDLYAEGPYHTTVARPGDTVKFVAAKGSMLAHIVVIPGTPDPAEGGATKRPPQVTNASIEDMIKTGTMTPDDLADDAKAQVIGRSPKLRTMIEEGEGAPEAQSVSDYVKTS